MVSKKDDDNKISSMEMEALNKQPSTTVQTGGGSGGGGSLLSLLSTNLCAFIKIWMEMNPIITSIFVFGIGVFLVVAIVQNLPRSDVKVNQVDKDYSELELSYTIKASDLKSWCLFGNDDKCNCQEFTNPQSRLTEPKWTNMYRHNIQQVKDAVNNQKQLDVVFVGDDLVQGLAGLGGPVNNPEAAQRLFPDQLQTQKLFNKTFHKNENGGFDGIALGIGGDATANLIWRLKNGEMDRNLQPYVWWIWIGTHDLGKGGCSEAATTLGILRTAEELHYHDPEADIVIMGILPRAQRSRGQLNPNHLLGPGNNGLLHHSTAHAKTIKDAYQRESLWPSIQRVNKELQDFCKKHPKIVYFDASDYFIGSMGNAHFSENKQEIITSLMPDSLHPSYHGYKLLINAISRELQRILYDDNEENDVETKADEIEDELHD